MPRPKNQIVSTIQGYWERQHALEKANKEIIEASSRLITAIDQQSFFFEGYRDGSASISECNHASDELNKAKSAIFESIKKIKANEAQII